MKNITVHFQEILEFAISVVWLGVAFGLALAGGYGALFKTSDLKTMVIQSMIVVFFAFVFHELAHRMLARRYGFHAVYHMWMPGLFVSLIGGLLGVIIAAPGGVVLGFNGTPLEAKKKIGVISLVGPVVNMLLALVFLGLAFGLVKYLDGLVLDQAAYNRWLPTLNMFWGVFIIGIEINSWLAVFNLLPFGSFDGYKVFNWSKLIWGVSFGISIGLYGSLLWAQGRLQ